MAKNPGILYVTMQPHSTLPPAQFHDWYNNEHGPIRLRLPFVSNGFRYRATDTTSFSKEKPEWMAIYDITDMSTMTCPEYTRLRDPNGVQTQRERDTMKQIFVDRKFYDLLFSEQGQYFRELEDVEAEGTLNVLVVVVTKLAAGADGAAFEGSCKQATSLLTGSKGWLRSRMFKTSTCDGQKAESEIEYMNIHEFSPYSEITIPPITSPKIDSQKTRHYGLCYTFGPAPRDLNSLSSPDALPTASSIDSRTKTFSIKESKPPVIESYITTADNTILPYRLEGSSSATAPLIVLINSILVTHNIWDGFLASFFSKTENLEKYRVLRYDTRGRLSTSASGAGIGSTGHERVTIDTLASDVITILDALRVKKARCVIGVSLGGATALTLGVRSPFSDRIESFISCDTSMKAPAGNSEAWSQRISIAEKESLSLPITSPYLAPPNTTQQKEQKVVGSELAEATVRRWFVPKSYEDPTLRTEIEKVKEMVKTNDLEGFKECVRALWEYDLEEEVRKSGVKGLFLVGEGDGALPRGMKIMSEVFGSGSGAGGKAELAVIEGAGHLPMVEKPVEFTSVVEAFLGQLY